jgi:DNA-directed RNA polymerase subunit RPC12/RpoP
MALVCKYCGGSNVQFLRPVSDFKSAQFSVVCMDCGAEF